LYHGVDGSYVIIFDQTAESGFVWETQETVTKRGALTITIESLIYVIRILIYHK
jgi:hypothetical protein